MKTKNIFLNLGIILLSVMIFTSISYIYNFSISKKKYLVNTNLEFYLNTGFGWNIISQRYENIINLYNTEEKENGLIENTLNKDNLHANINDIKIIPNVYGRQISIQYVAEDRGFGEQVVNSITNEIIQKNKEFMPNQMVGLHKTMSFVSEENIISNKNYNIIIFAIWGLAIGIGIVMILEAKCLLEKK